MARKKKVVIPEEYNTFSEDIVKQCEHIDITEIYKKIGELENKYLEEDWEFVIDSVKDLYKYIFGDEIKLVKKTVIKNKFFLLQRLEFCKKLCNDFYSLDLNVQTGNIEILFKYLLRGHVESLVWEINR